MVSAGDAEPRRLASAPFGFASKTEAPAAGDGLIKENEQWGSNYDGEMLWNENIADALGYGKNHKPRAAFQWWIPVVAALTCLGSFIAWATLVMRGRDATEMMMRELGVKFAWWADAKAVVVATAVLYPIFVVLALASSAWRAHLARTLNIHQPDSKWLASCRWFQFFSAATHTMLWLLVVLLVVSVASHAIWGYIAVVLDLVTVRAVALIGPVWSAVSKVADSSKALSDRFTGLLGSLPGIGRKLLEDQAAAGGSGAAAGTVGSLLAAAAAAGGGGGVLGAGGAGAGRELQQADGFLQGLGSLAQGIASGISAAANAIPDRIPGLPSNATIPFLPQLLPNGNDNPLFQAITNVTNAIGAEIFNPNGCPIYCIDLRAENWWADADAGCVCNLDRMEAALPYTRKAWQSILPAIVALIFMYIGASWLLMHGAAQWARTRNEAKLMTRIPAAAAAAAAAAGPSAPVSPVKGGYHEGGALPTV